MGGSLLVITMLAIAACTPASTVTPLPPASAISSPTQDLPTSPATSIARVVIDPSLLAVLPAAVAGLEVKESPEAENAALAGPELAAVGTAVAAGIAVDAPSGAFVYAVVVKLKPGVAVGEGRLGEQLMNGLRP
ncbi:MAG: hypothetical protein HYX54_09890 [Chloroflexi bacterium]|nr:hypothetical protein [Chloroflexota bacterium]